MTIGRRRNEGHSLIEVLVAAALMAVAVVVALTVYDSARKACASGGEAVAAQQAVRVAFDTVTSDLRRLGENVNPDGNAHRPDEPLEAALDHAVVFRGDFDRTDPVASENPETVLAGAAFSTVSTGNDEIVAYVLAKPDGTGPDAIVFQADVGEAPRDGAVERVTIDNVVLTPTSPPYTLYRVTLNNDPRTYGAPGFVVRTPVIDNVRDLTFVYYGPTGTFKDPSATISESVPAKEARSGLRRVHVSVGAVARQPGSARQDPATAAEIAFKTFELQADVTPRNVGLAGIPDLDLDLGPDDPAFADGDFAGRP